MRLRTGSLLVTVLMLIAACGGEPTGEEAVPTEVDTPAAEETGAVEAEVEESGPTEIAWFEGDLEAAFALAREEDKPLFLDWSIVWCPPCHYLETAVLHRPEFVAKSTAFVMYYLDGDTEGAQVLGENLDVKGYPILPLVGAGRYSRDT